MTTPSSAGAPGPITRFAPSPTGLLHLGHAYSALFAADAAAQAGGRFLLRIDDLDRARSRPEFEARLLEDLAWLGLHWPEPVYRQSGHFADYAAAFERLQALDVTYPCFCTRTRIRAELAAAPSAPHGPTGPVYPGTCRRLPIAEREAAMAQNIPHAWRLDARKAAHLTGPLAWNEQGEGPVAVVPALLGDVVLVPKDVAASYHLSVVVDDGLQGIGLVTRGRDLFEATHVHRMLQALLGLPEPAYWHHRLLVDTQGKRLAKRADSVAIAAYREAGYSADQVIALALADTPAGPPCA